MANSAYGLSIDECIEAVWARREEAYERLSAYRIQRDVPPGVIPGIKDQIHELDVWLHQLRRQRALMEPPVTPS